MKNKNKKEIMVPGGIYDSIDNYHDLPDEWNGNRWMLWLKDKFSNDEKEVRKTFDSLVEYNLLEAFPSVVIPKSFEGICDGKLKKYPKGGRLLTDRNRRFKALKMAKREGYKIVTPDGQYDKLPYIDQTPLLEDKHGKLTLKNLSAVVFQTLNIINVDQVEFSDESVIIGGAVCVSNEKDKKVFVYLKDKLKEYTDKSKKGALTVKLALMAILGRNKLHSRERRGIKIEYEMKKNRIEVSNFILEKAREIKKKLDGQAPAPFVEQFINLVYTWLKEKYFKYEVKTPLASRNMKTGEPTVRWDVVDECDDDLFTYNTFDEWKAQFQSIVNYITGTWKKQLDGEKLSGEKAVAKRAIKKEVKNMYDEHTSQ